MIVSFDLDDTLFVSEKAFQTEPPLPFPLRLLYKERLRAGTVALLRRLREQGHQVWIYTTSYRSERYIRQLFRQYGIRFDGIINRPRHLKEVQKNNPQPLPQKMPAFYRIGLHIDDEDVIHQNGRRYGFRTFKVCDPDEHWVRKVIAEAERIRDIEARLKKKG